MALLTCRPHFFLSLYATMNDQLITGHFKGLDTAFSCALSTQTVNETAIRHNCDPIAAHILGRALTGALLGAAVLPEKQRINVCWKYKGAVRTIIADAGQDGTVRAFISPSQYGEIQDRNDLYGDLGDIQTVISAGGKVLNSGTAPVSLQDASDDLAYYYCVSDQVETGICTVIGFNADPENPIRICQGWMIQALPGCDLERFERIRQRLHHPEFVTILNQTVELERAAGFLTEGEADFKGIYNGPVSKPKFTCPCSKEKMSAVIRTIPIPERMEIVKKGDPLEIRCQFCNEQYRLSIDECSAAWNRKPEN